MFRGIGAGNLKVRTMLSKIEQRRNGVIWRRSSSLIEEETAYVLLFFFIPLIVALLLLLLTGFRSSSRKNSRLDVSEQMNRFLVRFLERRSESDGVEIRRSYCILFIIIPCILGLSDGDPLRIIITLRFFCSWFWFLRRIKRNKP